MEEGNVEATKPKRKYTPRRICTDPELKYKYKPKPGPKPGATGRKRYKPQRTDAEKRRHARASANTRKGNATRTANGFDFVAQAQRLLKYHQTPEKISRRGIPDGMNRAQADEAWAKARARAEEFYEDMVEKGIAPELSADDFERVPVQVGDKVEIVLVPKTDEAKAAVALKEAMVMALGPIGNMQSKLGAINTVLKFTKSPPAQKVEVSKAEDLLAAALADIDKDK